MRDAKTSRDSGPDKGVRLEIAAYLRSQRDKLGLTQAEIAQRSKKLGVSFDHSWISHWERSGPKDSVLRSLTYLDLIRADLDLLAEMASVRVEFPSSIPESSREVCRQLQSLMEQGQLMLAQGMSILALRQATEETFSKHSLLMAASIVSRHRDMFSFALHLSDLGLSLPLGDHAKARALMHHAAVLANRGMIRRAKDALDELPTSAVEQDRSLRASHRHILGHIFHEERDAKLALELFKEALGYYSEGETEGVVPVLLSGIATNLARLGRRIEAGRVLNDVTRATRGPLAPLSDLYLSLEAGRVQLMLGEHSDALESLQRAEGLATKLGKPISAFETRVELLELGYQADSRALVRMLQSRISKDMPAFPLPPSLDERYRALVRSPRPGSID